MVETETITQVQARNPELDEFRFRLELEAEYRRRVGASMRGFAEKVAPDYPRHRHIELMMAALDKVERGELTHVMFLLPPQYWKSSTVSRLFPAFYLFKHPEKRIGLASYSGDLAHMMSRSAMDYYERAGMRLDPDVQATKEWMTEHGGGMWSAGVGGSISGRSLDVAIIDDPFKDANEAYSLRIRESRIDWYKSIWQSRNPKAEIIVSTRWHENDLIGWLLEQELLNPKRWHVFCFDAVKEEKPFEVPATCVLESDWRVPGEALCPAIHTGEQLVAKRKSAMELFWGSLWQQRPTVTKGNLWRAEWFYDNAFDKLPEGVTSIGTDWDTAYTDEDENAASAYVKAGRLGEAMYVMDVGFEWFEFPELVAWLRLLTPPHFVEDKASGKDLVNTLRRENIAAKEVSVQGDKESRTELVTPYAQNGKVKVARHLLDKLLHGKQGILSFPRGQHRDLNDALVQSMNRLLKNRPSLKFVGG